MYSLEVCQVSLNFTHCATGGSINHRKILTNLGVDEPETSIQAVKHAGLIETLRS
jgi:hypothetical protein